MFDEQVLQDHYPLAINSPALPCKYFAHQVQISSTSDNFHTSLEECYQQLYYESLIYVELNGLI